MARHVGLVLGGVSLGLIASGAALVFGGRRLRRLLPL